MNKNSESKPPTIVQLNELAVANQAARSAWYAAVSRNDTEEQRQASQKWRDAEMAFQECWNALTASGQIPIVREDGEGYRIAQR